VRSLDGGKTWAQVKDGLDYAWYIGIIGDGKALYTAGSGAGRPFFTSPETDGTTWAAYGGGAQTFSTEPFEMAYDSANGIVYSSNWGGLYALKVPAQDAALRSPPRRARAGRSTLLARGSAVLAEDGRGRRYSLPGRRLPE
jgi:hypothetical protein